MNYYEQKRQAINFIDDLINNGKSEDEIYYTISKRWGFGRKLVAERMKLFNSLVESRGAV